MQELLNGVAGGKLNTCQTLLDSAVAIVPRRVVIALILRVHRDLGSLLTGHELGP